VFDLFRFAYPKTFYFSIPLLFIMVFYRFWFRKPVTYKYSLAGYLSKQGFGKRYWKNFILWFMRVLSFFLLAFLIARPQLVDVTSKINVEGIDIFLVLDLSGSMELFDDVKDRRPRVQVAKEEALRFINKRENDQLGLVIFGREAVSRCPLTLDKNVLTDVIKELEIGVVDPRGTVISTAIITAANRLKHSKSKNKVMILLTDGEPSEEDLDIKFAIDIAKKLGIKIYTVGIGGEEGGLVEHPFYGATRASAPVNMDLLRKIAKETGGKFFEAKKPQDMRMIYDTIDKLEKTKIEANVFTNYQDIFMPFLWLVLVLLFVEFIFYSFLWFSL